MAGDRPRVCVALVSDDIDVMRSVEQYADFFEVRIDLIGESWLELVGHIRKSWIATNRLVAEGGKWSGSEQERIDELMKAAELGASIIDIELATEGLKDIVTDIRNRAQCLVSFHDFEKTPPLEEMKDIVSRQHLAGADICKVVVTARSMADNVTVLRLFREIPGVRLVAFAMGETGQVSRVTSPLAGGYFTFASARAGGESAPGQITAKELRAIYQSLGRS